MSDVTAMEAKLRQAFEENVPFNRVLGLKVDSIDPEAAKLRFDMRPELIGNPRRQVLHGGVISAVLDVAAGFAIYLAVNKEHDITRSEADRFRPSARSICASTICGRGKASISSRPGAWCASAAASRSRTPKWSMIRAT